MAIFNYGNKSSGQQNSSTTIITEGSKIKGQMNLTCGLYIDGEFEGTINSTGTVTLGKNGKVLGEIFAQKVLVQGFIDGLVDCERIEILSHGRVVGSVVSSELIIEAKAQFEGESKIKPNSINVKQEKPKQLKTAIKKVESELAEAKVTA